MLTTPKYGFKKRELTDSPPNIAATEDNWDKAEYELNKQSEQINVLSDDTTRLGAKGLTLNSKIFSDLKGTNLNSYFGKTINAFIINATTNTPENATVHGWISNTHYNGEVFAPSGSYGSEEVNYQTWKTYNSNITWERTVVVKSSDKSIISDTGWSKVATTTKTDISFPYDTGYSDYDSSYGTLLSKNSLNEVILNIYAKPTSGTFGTSTVKIGTLPVGYRPKKNIESNARTSSGIGTLTLYTTGAVNVTMTSGTSNYISGTFVFDGI